jgi:TonB family protein
MEYTSRYPADPSLKPKLMLSLAFHGALAALMIVTTILGGRGDSWGSNGSGVTVGLVRSMPAIPLPKPEVVSQSRVVDESQGLYKEEPKPKDVQIPPTAQPIPAFEREKPKLVPSKPSRILENNVTPPPNAVPYGGGGPPTLPYSNFALSDTTKGGVDVTGAGGGEFGSKYSWFVDAVRTRISSNWLQSMVDPSVSTAPRAVLTFQILRDGTITNIQILQTSGNTSVDNSARRAILSSSPVLKLPNDYSGSVVNVEFWFDFHR